MRVILDALQAGSVTSQADALKKAGVTVKLMRGIKANGIMHHKVANLRWFGRANGQLQLDGQCELL